MIPEAPYIENAKHDQWYCNILRLKKEEIRNGNDDAIFLFGGPTGSGKTSLALWGLHCISDAPDIDKVALTRQEFAQAHNTLKKNYVAGLEERYLLDDELDLNKRKAMSEWNTDKMRLYQTNRVFGGFHFWCNPFIEMIDKPFVKERVTGMFFVLDKSQHKPRKYVFLAKKGLLKMVDAGIELSTFNVRKYAQKYGFYIGWFKKYDGSLLKEYEKKKIEGSAQVDQDFFEKYSGAKTHSLAETAKVTHISLETLRATAEQLMDQGVFREGTQRTETGRWRLNLEDIEQLKIEIRNRNNKNATKPHETRGFGAVFP